MRQLMNSNKYLLIFTIGPVQSFIAQARKTRDLHAGSLLLSKLIKDVGNEAIKKYNATPLFPARKLFEENDIITKNEISSLPNRFVMFIDNANAGKCLEQYARIQFRIKMLNHIFQNNNCPSSCLSQVENFLQIYWIVYPIAGLSYLSAYEKASLQLGAVKNTRIFQQSSEVGRKCSLCGERTAFFYYSSHRNANKKLKSGHFLHRYFALDAVNLKNKIDFGFTEGEGLCTICYYKRSFEDKRKKSYYYSTAKIALLDALNSIKESMAKEYEKIFNNKFDEQLYFEENLTKSYFTKQDIPLSILTKAQNGQKKIVTAIKEQNQDLTKYYALIILDGDNMGKWFSGRWLYDKERLEDFHKFVTNELTNYAAKVQTDYVTDKHGQLVYTGGDDVLAFINLNHIFDVTKKLFKNFPRFNNNESIKIKSGKSAHPSCGIVIAHYKTPLSEVLKWARMMEKKAKGLKDKHGIGVAAITHSGTIKQCIFKYNPHFNTFKNIVFGFKNHYSDRFIFVLKEEFFKVFENQQIPSYQTSQHIDMILTELKRLMMRSKIKKDKATTDFIRDRAEDVRPLLVQQVQEETSIDINNFISFFEIARFLSSKITKER
ncbi:MAG: type III-B CRISPR-associated protein Cas10/Cmr2 [Candidatus Lokiarchaeota archaeon]|nr:type III-B CRISPR-associated protein Cas10/Cmr2 [Candidatus Lokiarchaeota archaeon]